MTKTTERKLARTHAEQIALAKDELKIEKQWQKDGGKEPKPELPNLDAVRARSDARTQQRANGSSTSTSTPRVPKMTGLRFFHDDKPQPDNQNKLSTMAYDYTRKVDGDTPRVSTARLREILAGLGIDDAAKPFKCTLPNGVVLELRSESVKSSPSPVDASTGKSASGTAVAAARSSKPVDDDSIDAQAAANAAAEVHEHDDEITVTAEQDAATTRAAKAAGAAKRTGKKQPTQAQKDARNAKRRADRAAASTKGPRSLSNLLP